MGGGHLAAFHPLHRPFSSVFCYPSQTMPPQLNFERAEYHGQSVTLDHCVFCSRGINGEFYRTNGDLTCTVCAAHLQRVLPHPTRQTYIRSAGYGLTVATGASLAYLLIYRLLERYGLAANTAFASIAVGYAVGHAMRWAGPAARGRRFQLTGAVLTYAAVAIANSAGLLSLRGVPVYAYPFLVFAPLVSLFVDRYQEALFLLFFISIGIRWTWTLLRPHGVQITGPETLAIADPTKLERK
jgi:hypothetical protein